MDFKQIEAFVNVVKYKSFSKAADATYLTQPTISVHIRALEMELGTTLLDRQGKQVTPTAQGKTFYKYAMEIMATREKVLSTFSNVSEHLEGVLDIQTSSSPGQDFIPWTIKAFADANPRVHFFVEQSDTKQVLENIVGGKGELGFVGSIGSKSLIYEPIFDDEPRLIVSRNSRVGQIQGDEIDIEEFINEPFLWREQGSASREDFERFLKANGYRENSLNVIARINSIGVIRKSVAAGLGISLVSSKSIGEKDYMMGMKAFKIRGYNKIRTFYMAYRKKAYLSPVAEAFKDFVLSRRSDAFKNRED